MLQASDLVHELNLASNCHGLKQMQRCITIHDLSATVELLVANSWFYTLRLLEI